MENRVVNYKGYVISTEEGKGKGLFFRNPLQKVYFDAYYDDPILSAWKYNVCIEPAPIAIFRPLLDIPYDISISNQDFIQSPNRIFNILYIRFPIYFKREYRKLVAHSCESGNIQKIVSYGYESEFNMCSGECDMEKTVIHLKNGKTIRIKRKEQYHFTYEHIIKKIIDTGIIEND